MWILSRPQPASSFSLPFQLHTHLSPSPYCPASVRLTGLLSAREPILRCKQIQIPRLDWSGTRVALNKLRASSCILLPVCKRKRIRSIPSVLRACLPSTPAGCIFEACGEPRVARPTRSCGNLKSHTRSCDITGCSSCKQDNNPPPKKVGFPNKGLSC